MNKQLEAWKLYARLAVNNEGRKSPSSGALRKGGDVHVNSTFGRGVVNLPYFADEQYINLHKPQMKAPQNEGAMAP